MKCDITLPGRTARGIVADLTEAGCVIRQKDGRRSRSARRRSPPRIATVAALKPAAPAAVRTLNTAGAPVTDDAMGRRRPAFASRRRPRRRCDDRRLSCV